MGWDIQRRVLSRTSWRPRHWRAGRAVSWKAESDSQGQRDDSNRRAGDWQTHTAMFKDPEGSAILVHLIPEAQAAEDPPRHVTHGPKVQREEDDHQYRLAFAREEGDQIPCRRVEE